MTINNIEKRFLGTELRADIENRLIKGTAIVFNCESRDLGGFTETIKPESVTPELINNSDIVMLYNHNDNVGVLARSKNGKGSLKINITSKGVEFEFRAKDTALGNEVLSAVAAGDLDACSFAFRISENGDQWEKRDNNTYLRTINKFESLHDFSIVVTPAYESTSVSARSMDKLKELKELDKVAMEKSHSDNSKFNRYYKSLVAKYLN